MLSSQVTVRFALSFHDLVLKLACRPRERMVCSRTREGRRFLLQQALWVRFFSHLALLAPRLRKNV